MIRRGFTLLEVLLVLAILAFMLAVAAPSFNRWLSQRQVQEAARSVCSKLFKARLGAMRSSQIYSFQYQTGSGSYRLSPQNQSASQSGDSGKSSSGQGTYAVDADGPPPEEGSLPEGVRFLPDDAPDDNAENSQDVARSNGANGWSDPIFFYPDGTTSNAKLLVADTRGYAIHIRLRGLTGNVVLGSTTRAPEQLP